MRQQNRCVHTLKTYQPDIYKWCPETGIYKNSNLLSIKKNNKFEFLKLI